MISQQFLRRTLDLNQRRDAISFYTFGAQLIYGQGIMLWVIIAPKDKRQMRIYEATQTSEDINRGSFGKENHRMTLLRIKLTSVGELNHALRLKQMLNFPIFTY